METFQHDEAGAVTMHQLSDGSWWCGGQIALTKNEAMQNFCTRWSANPTNWGAVPYDSATASGIYDRDC